MEEDVQRNIKHKSKSQVSLNVAALRASIIGNQDVVFYWSIAAAQFDEKEAELLLEKITDLWITVRGFAYTSGWLEQYKQKEKKGIQKSKSLRTRVQCSTEDT